MQTLYADNVGAHASPAGEKERHLTSAVQARGTSSNCFGFDRTYLRAWGRFGTVVHAPIAAHLSLLNKRDLGRYFATGRLYHVVLYIHRTCTCRRERKSWYQLIRGQTDGIV
jgi:hypothetical protein